MLCTEAINQVHFASGTFDVVFIQFISAGRIVRFRFLLASLRVFVVYTRTLAALLKR